VRRLRGPVGTAFSFAVNFVVEALSRLTYSSSSDPADGQAMADDERTFLAICWNSLTVFVSLLYLGAGFFSSIITVTFVRVSWPAAKLAIAWRTGFITFCCLGSSASHRRTSGPTLQEMYHPQSKLALGDGCGNAR
jgi:hypothetical protein